MPLLVNSVPNLAQGVSQQPDNLRYPGQCDEQINAWATVVEGLVKRPHTSYVKNVDSSQPSNLFTHFVKRDETNKYVINVSVGGSVSAFNLSLGTSIPVVTTSIAQAYLSGITNPTQELRALTVADYTFLVNKSKTVRVNPSEDLKSQTIKNDDGRYEALVFVKLGDYEKTYNVILDGKEIPYGGTGLTSNKAPPAGHTYESGSSAHGVHADTEVIAQDLEIVLNAYFSGDTAVDTGGPTVGTGSGWDDTSKATSVKGYIYTTYEFFIDQYQTSAHTTQIGFGAKGTVVFKNGVVKSATLTHPGTGYDNAIGTADPNTYKYSIRKIVENGWVSPYQRTVQKTDITSANAASYGVTMPTFTTPTLLGTDYQVERQGAVLRVTNNKDFSIRTEDGLANQGLGVAYKEVGSITDLPKRCFDDFRVKIRGDADIDQDDYYVQFQTKDKEDYGEGSWVECVGWESGVESAAEITSIDTTIDPESMPVTLVPKIDNNGRVIKFTLQAPNELSGTVEYNGTIYNVIKEHVSSSTNIPGTSGGEEYWIETTDFTTAPDWELDKKYDKGYQGYAPRKAGDDITNPFPSFVNQTINDIFFFKNRLGFLTNNAVIFSEADAYFNFFRTTTQQLLDSAPIDVGLSHTKVAVLQHAIPFQEKLMLFSKQSQFVLRGADILSPKTVAISPVTEYDISDSINP